MVLWFLGYPEQVRCGFAPTPAVVQMRRKSVQRGNGTDDKPRVHQLRGEAAVVAAQLTWHRTSEEHELCTIAPWR
jgi:hypothetical protein